MKSMKSRTIKIRGLAGRSLLIAPSPSPRRTVIAVCAGKESALVWLSPASVRRARDELTKALRRTRS